MRTSTFFVSLLVHTLVIGGVVVTRLVANDELPEPPRASTFILVTPDIPSIPPPAPPRRSEPIAADADAAPIEEPAALRPELPLRIVDDAPVADDLVSTGLGIAGGLPQSDVVAPPPPRPIAPVAPVRVGGDVRPPQKVRHVVPEYPAIARSAGISGVVILEALIGDDGSVRDVTVLRSVALLDTAAVEAVRQWRFTPTLLNGTPVPVLMTVTVAFNLSR